jgi:hypothetical protein
METPTIPQIYERDYPLWLKKTTEYLRSGNFEALDIDNLVAELEEMGGSRKDALENNLIVVLTHLLKWKYQPSYRCGSWRGSIKEHRRRINKSLAQHPGLKPYIQEIFPECNVMLLLESGRQRKREYRWKHFLKTALLRLKKLSILTISQNKGFSIKTQI